MNDENRNVIEILENGPIYFRGNIEVRDAEGGTLLNRTKVAMCRCGSSAGKPVCDGTHKKVDFEAPASADLTNVPESAQNGQDPLVLRLMENGPLLVNGTYTIVSSETGEHTSDKKIALCRCGGSSNKPFCDGRHKELSFES